MNRTTFVLLVAALLPYGPVWSQEEADTNQPQSGQVTSLLSSEGKLLFASEPNSLLVIDYPENVQRIAEFLEMVDVPAPQVVIEARVVEVKLQGEHALGVNWNLLTENEGLKIGSARLTSPSASNRGPIQQLIPFKPTFFPPLGSTGQETPFSLTIFTDNISVVVQALANALQTEILSAPRITTVNNEEAEIKVIRRLPWAEPTVTNTGAGPGAGSSNVQVTWKVNFEEVGIKLGVKPIINTDEGTISMTLNPEVSEKVSDFALSLIAGSQTINYTVPVVDRREASTRVIIGNHQTLIIGGLIKDSRTSGVSKIAGAGDLPVVGSLFRSKKDTKDKSELLIFVSPTIIDSVELVRHRREERYGLGRKFTQAREQADQMIRKREHQDRGRGERLDVHTQLDALTGQRELLTGKRRGLEESIQAEDRALRELIELERSLGLQKPPMKEHLLPARRSLPTHSAPP